MHTTNIHRNILPPNYTNWTRFWLTVCEQNFSSEKMTFDSPIEIQTTLPSSNIVHKFVTTVGFIQAQAYKELIPFLPTTLTDVYVMREEYHNIKKCLFSSPEFRPYINSPTFALLERLINPTSSINKP